MSISKRYKKSYKSIEQLHFFFVPTITIYICYYILYNILSRVKQNHNIIYWCRYILPRRIIVWSVLMSSLRRCRDVRLLRETIATMRTIVSTEEKKHDTYVELNRWKDLLHVRSSRHKSKYILLYYIDIN